MPRSDSLVSCIGLLPAVGSRSAISATRSAWSSGTPSATSVCGTPISRRSAEHPFEKRLERGGQPEIGRQTLDPRLDRGAVEDEHIGHEHGVGHAVVGPVQRTDGMRERVDRAEALLERRRAHRGGGHQHRARLDVGAGLHRARQIVLDEPHALDRDAVGERMEARGAIGFETMRQRIHADASGEARRQADRQLGVENRDSRHHPRMEDDLLGVRRLVGDDAGAADFRAGARSRGHGDDRSNAIRIGAGPPIPDVLEVPHRPRLPGHEGDYLADVQRGAAAERDDAVVAAGAIGREPVLDVARDRIRLDLVEDIDPEARRSA